jgi:hypothetical protein
MLPIFMPIGTSDKRNPSRPTAAAPCNACFFNFGSKPTVPQTINANPTNAGINAVLEDPDFVATAEPPSLVDPTGGVDSNELAMLFGSDPKYPTKPTRMSANPKTTAHFAMIFILSV